MCVIEQRSEVEKGNKVQASTERMPFEDVDVFGSFAWFVVGISDRLAIPFYQMSSGYPKAD